MRKNFVKLEHSFLAHRGKVRLYLIRLQHQRRRPVFGAGPISTFSLHGTSPNLLLWYIWGY